MAFLVRGTMDGFSVETEHFRYCVMELHLTLLFYLAPDTPLAVEGSGTALLLPQVKFLIPH